MCLVDRQKGSTGSVAGNAALDIVLFLPIALLFLFVVVDAGLLYVERSAVTDAVRAGLHAEYGSERPFQVLVQSLEGDYEVDPVEASDLAEFLLGKILSNLSAVHAPSGVGQPRRFVEVSVFGLAIDASSGVVKPNRVERIHSAYSTGQDSLPYADNAEQHYQSREEFIQRTLDADVGVSRFAEPNAPIHLSTGGFDSVHRFIPTAVLVYVDVRGIADGIHPNFVSSTLGRFYAYQVQQLSAQRTPGR